MFSPNELINFVESVLGRIDQSPDAQKALYFMTDDIYHERETPIDQLNQICYRHLERLCKSKRIEAIIDTQERRQTLNALMKSHFAPNLLTDEDMKYL